MVGEPQKRPRCPVCRGWGYIPCDCWPGDCLCGYGDEDCEYCDGTGDVLPDDYESFGATIMPDPLIIDSFAGGARRALTGMAAAAADQWGAAASEHGD